MKDVRPKPTFTKSLCLSLVLYHLAQSRNLAVGKVAKVCGGSRISIKLTEGMPRDPSSSTSQSFVEAIFSRHAPDFSSVAWSSHTLWRFFLRPTAEPAQNFGELRANTQHPRVRNKRGFQILIKSSTPSRKTSTSYEPTAGGFSGLF